MVSSGGSQVKALDEAPLRIALLHIPPVTYLCEVEFVILPSEVFSLVVVAGGDYHVHSHHAQNKHVENG